MRLKKLQDIQEAPVPTQWWKDALEAAPEMASLISDVYDFLQDNYVIHECQSSCRIFESSCPIQLVRRIERQFGE